MPPSAPNSNSAMLAASLCEQKIQTLFQKISHQRSEAWNLDPARWDWSSGVSHFGLLEVYRATGDRAVLDYLETWLGRVADQRKFGSVNNVILANVPLLLLQQGRGQGDRTVCTEYARWCHEGSLRTSIGGWAHVWEGGDPDYRHQLWIDTMFMGVVFLARHGVAFQHPADLAEALKQLIIHLDCLFDEKAGLFRHTYHCEQKILLGEHWSRGNGWMVPSIVKLLELLATPRATAHRGQAALRCRDGNGLSGAGRRRFASNLAAGRRGLLGDHWIGPFRLCGAPRSRARPVGPTFSALGAGAGGNRGAQHRQ